MLSSLDRDRSARCGQQLVFRSCAFPFDGVTHLTQPCQQQRGCFSIEGGALGVRGARNEFVFRWAVSASFFSAGTDVFYTKYSLESRLFEVAKVNFLVVAPPINGAGRWVPRRVLTGLRDTV